MEKIMNFVGTGARLKQGDVGKAARVLGVETAVLLAVLEVEAAGRGFDTQNRLKILFEPHIFYRRLGKGAKRDRAVRGGLAYRSWGTKTYPKSYNARYAQLKKAMKIDKDAALKSCSWALPQIMGFNYKAAGFTSPSLMVRAMLQGEYEQVLALVTLIKSWGLDVALKGKDFSKPNSWRAFAKRYNGSSYAKHNYHGLMAKAYRKHSKGKAMQLPAYRNDNILQEGTKGEVVRNLQGDLTALGYRPGPIDGRFGDKTHRAVIAFQISMNIAADGKVGRVTYQKLKAAIDALPDEKEKADEVVVKPANAGWLVDFLAAIMQIIKSLGGKN